MFLTMMSSRRVGWTTPTSMRVDGCVLGRQVPDSIQATAPADLRQQHGTASPQKKIPVYARGEWEGCGEESASSHRSAIAVEGTPPPQRSVIWPG